MIPPTVVACLPVGFTGHAPLHMAFRLELTICWCWLGDHRACVECGQEYMDIPPLAWVGRLHIGQYLLDCFRAIASRNLRLAVVGIWFAHAAHSGVVWHLVVAAFWPAQRESRCRHLFGWCFWQGGVLLFTVSLCCSLSIVIVAANESICG